MPRLTAATFASPITAFEGSVTRPVMEALWFAQAARKDTKTKGEPAEQLGLCTLTLTWSRARCDHPASLIPFLQPSPTSDLPAEGHYCRKRVALRGHSNGANRCVPMIASHLKFFPSLVPVVLFLRRERAVKLVKTSRPLAATFGHSLCTKRTAKISFGLIAAVFLLQFYYVRELLFAEVLVVLGFVVVALIGALYALGYIAALWLWKLGSWLKALGALVSVRHRQPFAETTVTGLSDAKEEVS